MENWEKFSVAKHRISLNLPDATPICAVSFLAGARHRNRKWKEIDQMIKAIVAEPFFKEWAMAAVFVSKKGRCLRFCVDNRCFAVITVRDSYQIHGMNECIELLVEAQLFSTLNANSRNWQIELAERDVYKAGFVTHHDLFRYSNMPFALKYAPKTFHRTMNVIFAFFKCQFGVARSDDLIIISRSPQQHLRHTEEVMRLMKEAGITVKL